MFAKALHRIGHRLVGIGWRRWWEVVHGCRTADARSELGMAHDAMTSEMMSQLKLTAMGMMDKAVRRMEHRCVSEAWGSWVWYVDEGARRDGLLRRCLIQLVRAHAARGWRGWVWCTEESRRREEVLAATAMRAELKLASSAMGVELKLAAMTMLGMAMRRISHRLANSAWLVWREYVHEKRSGAEQESAPPAQARRRDDALQGRTRKA